MLPARSIRRNATVLSLATVLWISSQAVAAEWAFGGEGRSPAASADAECTSTKPDTAATGYAKAPGKHDAGRGDGFFGPKSCSTSTKVLGFSLGFFLGCLGLAIAVVLDMDE